MLSYIKLKKIEMFKKYDVDGSYINICIQFAFTLNIFNVDYNINHKKIMKNEEIYNQYLVMKFIVVKVLCK